MCEASFFIFLLQADELMLALANDGGYASFFMSRCISMRDNLIP
jgi:hypothetical protein